MKNFVKVVKNKFALLSMMAAVAMISVMGSASAAVTPGTADQGTVDAMSTSFDSVKLTALLALASIAGIAIVLFAGIYAWKYGKKVFSIIAK